MCGIAGAVAETGVHHLRSALETALDTLEHRGPDDQGVLETDRALLGVRRLAVIDLETGAQPISNEDDSVTVVSNGEIYNFIELRRALLASGHRFRTRSDTEVLVHLYEEHGESLCDHLRGMYAFALWDHRRRRLLLGRDRFGKKPLYYANLPGRGLFFASELKALRQLLAAAGIRVEMRQQAIYDYLSLGVVPQPETVYEGVFAVSPGHLLELADGETHLFRYWAPTFLPKRRMPYVDALTEVRRLVAEAVELRLRSDVPVGVFLSGGVDSSIVAYEAARRAGGRLTTFTVSVSDHELDEAPVARRTARYLGVDWEELPLHIDPRDEVLFIASHYDQPFADSSAIPSLAVSRLARSCATVVLNGDGGDEVFGGYRRYLATRALAVSESAPLLGWMFRAAAPMASRKRRRSTAGFFRRFTRGLNCSIGERHLVWTTDLLLERDKLGAWRGTSQRATEEWLAARLPAGLSRLDTQVAGDIDVNLVSDLLVKMDMATMAASLEARSPMLDHRVAEFALRLPDHYRVRGWSLKAVLRDAYRGRVPDEVVRGKKRGFEVPLSRWLEGDLYELVHDALGSSTALVLEFVDRQLIGEILSGGVAREWNEPALVYALLVLELWLHAERARGLAA